MVMVGVELDILHNVNGFVVPSTLWLQSSDLVGSEHTFCSSIETLCTVVFHCRPNSEFVSGFHSVHGTC